MNEFFVGKFRIDMERSQIVAQDDIVSIEPKVLQVLFILAKNQGQVVSHETILDEAWPDIQVAPNALQRCIAQLRKAFNDDAKTQRVIATHPKVGYSLLSEVNWQSKLESAEASASSMSQSQKNGMSRILGSSWLWLVGFVTLVGLAFMLNRSTESLPLKHLTALTTTDKREFSPTYSPDGQYIAFQRYVGSCKNQIWAIDLKDNREYLLTKESGIYGTPSWSPDSQQLAFSSVTRCGQERELSGCKEIRAISFVLAKTNPQKTHKLLACDEQDYGAIVWLTNEQIAFYAQSDLNNQVMTLSLNNGPEKSKPVSLYLSEEQKPYSLSYSAKHNKLAVMQHDRVRNTNMLLINPDTGDFDKVELKIADEFKSTVYWNVNFHPINESLITAVDDTFFEIAFNGDMTAQSIPTMQGVYDPYFHPDGTSIVASLGVLDTDIAEVQWNAASHKPNLTTLERSILTDKEAVYQPSGDNIAFISSRTGSRQIWLTEKNQDKAKQLSHLLPGKYDVDSFVWSLDGQLIIYAARRQLHLLSLDGQTQMLDTPFKVLNIYQYLNNQKLLLSVILQQQVKTISFDINSKQYEVLHTGQIRWAQLTKDDELFISDQEMKINQIAKGIEVQVPELTDIKNWSGFIYKEGQLFILDDKRNLWQYELTRQSKKLILKQIDNIKYMTDIDFKNKRLLATQVISSKKEIVIFD